MKQRIPPDVLKKIEVKIPAASGGTFKAYSNRFNCGSPAFSM
jgi:hypothetical protein